MKDSLTPTLPPPQLATFFQVERLQPQTMLLSIVVDHTSSLRIHTASSRQSELSDAMRRDSYTLQIAMMSFLTWRDTFAAIIALKIVARICLISLLFIEAVTHLLATYFFTQQLVLILVDVGVLSN